jgi:hypothetical protein
MSKIVPFVPPSFDPPLAEAPQHASPAFHAAIKALDEINHQLAAPMPVTRETYLANISAILLSALVLIDHAGVMLSLIGERREARLVTELNAIGKQLSDMILSKTPIGAERNK